MMFLTGSAPPAYATIMLYSLARECAKLVRITEDELKRARNRLKCELLYSLESHTNLCDDIGQLLVRGVTADYDAMCKNIDAVDKNQLERL